MSTLKSPSHSISPQEKAKELILSYSVVSDFDNATTYQKMIALSHANQSVNLIIQVLLTQDVYSSSVLPVYEYYTEVGKIIWEQYINLER
jgi:hypothetical protein